MNYYEKPELLLAIAKILKCPVTAVFYAKDPHPFGAPRTGFTALVELEVGNPKDTGTDVRLTTEPVSKMTVVGRREVDFTVKITEYHGSAVDVAEQLRLALFLDRGRAEILKAGFNYMGASDDIQTGTEEADDRLVSVASMTFKVSCKVEYTELLQPGFDYIDDAAPLTYDGV